MSGIGIGIVGAGGRMGQMLAREAHAAGFRLVGGTEAPGSPNLGKMNSNRSIPRMLGTWMSGISLPSRAMRCATKA